MRLGAQFLLTCEQRCPVWAVGDLGNPGLVPCSGAESAARDAAPAGGPAAVLRLCLHPVPVHGATTCHATLRCHIHWHASHAIASVVLQVACWMADGGADAPQFGMSISSHLEASFRPIPSLVMTAGGCDVDTASTSSEKHRRVTDRIVRCV